MKKRKKDSGDLASEEYRKRIEGPADEYRKWVESPVVIEIPEKVLELESRISVLEERFGHLVELFTSVANESIYSKGRELVASLEKDIAKAIEESASKVMLDEMIQDGTLRDVLVGDDKETGQ